MSVKLKPAIVTCSGAVLTAAERAIFAAERPLGLIIFQRNCQSPAQVRSLIADFRETTQNPTAPVLIDQEGGRVARLRPPHWLPSFPASIFGQLWEKSPEQAIAACTLQAELIGTELAALGISANCAPVLDLSRPETHQAIGDRAYSANPTIVIALARVYAAGLQNTGVLPIIKHLPGHGRAERDPHYELPVVTCSAAELIATDGQTFLALNNLPLGMTSHLLLPQLDQAWPVSLSATIHQDIIRHAYGFQGLLFSDDLDMQAIKLPIAERGLKALAAGTDIVIYCNQQPENIAAFLQALPTLAAPSKMLAVLQPPQPTQRLSLSEGHAKLVEMLQPVLTSSPNDAKEVSHG